MDKLIITTVQTDLHWENKEANLDMLGTKIMGIKEKTNIVVLPEMFSTGFTMQPELMAEKMDGETIAWMRNIAREKGIILAGHSQGSTHISMLLKDFFDELLQELMNKIELICLSKNTKTAIATLFNFDHINLSPTFKVCRNSAGYKSEPRLCEERTVKPFLN